MGSRRRLMLVPAVAFVTALGAACGGGSTTEGTSEAVAPAAGTSDAAPAVPEALAFTAPLLGGGTFDGAAYVGRPVAFWFWAPY